MDPANAITLLLLLAIPVGVLVLLIRPATRSPAMPRRDGPLGAFVGGLALIGWVSFVGPAWSQPVMIAGAVLVGIGVVWHLARTVRRLAQVQA